MTSQEGKSLTDPLFPLPLARSWTAYVCSSPPKSRIRGERRYIVLEVDVPRFCVLHISDGGGMVAMARTKGGIY